MELEGVERGRGGGGGRAGKERGVRWNLWRESG
jgi:hypothetical protein